MRRRALAILGWTIVALCLWPWQAAGRQQARRSSADSNANHNPSVVQGLLGPVAGLAASAEWVRFDWYVREGRLERAYAAASYRTPKKVDMKLLYKLSGLAGRPGRLSGFQQT